LCICRPYTTHTHTHTHTYICMNEWRTTVVVSPRLSRDGIDNIGRFSIDIVLFFFNAISENLAMSWWDFRVVKVLGGKCVFIELCSRRTLPRETLPVHILQQRVHACIIIAVAADCRQISDNFDDVVKKLPVLLLLLCSAYSIKKIYYIIQWPSCLHFNVCKSLCFLYPAT